MLFTGGGEDGQEQCRPRSRMPGLLWALPHLPPSFLALSKRACLSASDPQLGAGLKQNPPANNTPSVTNALALLAPRAPTTREPFSVSGHPTCHSSYWGRGLGGHALSHRGICPESGSRPGRSAGTCLLGFILCVLNCPRLFWHADRIAVPSDLGLLQTACPRPLLPSLGAGPALGPRGCLHSGLLLASSSHSWFFQISSFGA